MRIVIAALVAAALIAGGMMLWRSRPVQDTAWRDYKKQFLAADGRVLDIGNGRVSHTEGQGYAMLFAVAANDPATFDSVWTWTRKTLRRPDGLFSWRYIPGAQSTVPDKNNATDGDLVICWALARAATAWGRPADHDAALDLATALHAVIDEDGEDAFLKPGVEGFTGEGKRVVNLSYWVFPALAEIARLTDDR